MTGLLEMRGIILSIYKKFERPINIIAKFFMLFVLYNKVCGIIPGTPLDTILVVVALSVVSIVLPIKWVLFVSGTLAAGVLVVAGKLALGGLVLVVVLITYLAAIRMVPKLAYIILAVPLAYMLNIPLAVPLFVGLFLGLEAIIPLTIGVVLKFSIDFLPTVFDQATDDIFQIPQIVINITTEYITFLMTNKAFLSTLIVFIGVVAVTYLIRRFSLDYAPYIGIIGGTLLYLIGMVMSILIMQTNLNGFVIIIQALLSAVVVAVMQFFKVVYHYQRVEIVQYEDDDYQYFVKAVPKIKYTTSTRKIKKIKNISKDR